MTSTAPLPWPAPVRVVPRSDVDLTRAEHVVDAEHQCMTLRGVRVGGPRTTTSTLRGVLREDARSRAEFLARTSVAPATRG